jgi:quercetin dioxygenase-like cupin family protein
MRALITFLSVVTAVLLASVTLTAGCARETSSQGTAASAPTRSEALILQESDGERRVHRPPPGALSNLTAPFTLKVDRRNGGAPEFVMMTEDIPPGQAISPHRHPHSDEIIFIHGGTGLASLAGRQANVAAGTTIYMPRNAVVGLRNTGTEPLSIVAIFLRPGYEEYLREISVPDGETPKPLTIEELSTIRSHHLDTVVYQQP